MVSPFANAIRTSLGRPFVGSRPSAAAADASGAGVTGAVAAGSTGAVPVAAGSAVAVSVAAASVAAGSVVAVSPAAPVAVELVAPGVIPAFSAALAAAVAGSVTTGSSFLRTIVKSRKTPRTSITPITIIWTIGFSLIAFLMAGAPSRWPVRPGRQLGRPTAWQESWAPARRYHPASEP